MRVFTAVGFDFVNMIFVICAQLYLFQGTLLDKMRKRQEESKDRVIDDIGDILVAQVNFIYIHFDKFFPFILK